MIRRLPIQTAKWSLSSFPLDLKISLPKNQLQTYLPLTLELLKHLLISLLKRTQASCLTFSDLDTSQTLQTRLVEGCLMSSIFLMPLSHFHVSRFFGYEIDEKHQKRWRPSRYDPNTKLSKIVVRIFCMQKFCPACSQSSSMIILNQSCKSVQ